MFTSKMKFNSKEKKDLFFAGIMISLAFAILISGGIESLISSSSIFVVSFFVAFFTAGIGFLLHEMMHKYVAQKYGYKAEFNAFYGMLWLAILFSLFGFIIAAPGAVMIHGRITSGKNGKIALAGPLTNIFLAILFLMFIFLIDNNFVNPLLKVGLTINSLLALFNMIPAIPFDGGQVFVWNKKIYIITTIVAVSIFTASLFI